MPAQVGQLRQHRQVILLELVEHGPHPRGQLMVDADALRQRVDIMAFALKGEVQMGSGRQAARAHPADDLAQGHEFAIRQPPCDFRQMAVNAHHSLRVIQPYASSQFSAPSGVLDPSVRDRLDWGAVFGH